MDTVQRTKVKKMVEEYSERKNGWKEMIERNYFSNNNDIIHKLNASLYSSFDQRLATFNNWPLSFPDKRCMAGAGFYYSKVEDRTTCFFCNNILSQWTFSDNPYVEHAFWYPHCMFIRSIMGELNMKRIEELPKTSDGPTRTNLYNSIYSSCMLCHKNTINIILIPCKHAKYCDECIISRKDKKCPSCGEYIYMVLTIEK